MKKSIIIASSVILSGYTLLAQSLPTRCGGTSPATSCEDVCISCNFDGYTGSTFGFPGGEATEFCGTVENMQWLGFIAGAEEATFTVTPTDCANGDGLQIALYDNCKNPPLGCNKGMKGWGAKAVSIKVKMIPGTTYFLLVDGYANDQCEFVVSVSPKEAVYEPPLGTVGAITGPDKLCPGATAEYFVQPVFGAGAFIWDGPPGSMIDTFPMPVTMVGAEKGRKVKITIGNTGGKICVQAANACSVNAPCTASMDVQILDDSYKPKIEVDTLDHLSCSGQPAVITAGVKPNGTYNIQWVSDSLGRLVSGEKTLKPRVDRKGTYTLTVENTLNGCSSTQAVRVDDPDIPSGVVLGIDPVSCFGKKDASISVDSVLGGKDPYLYSLNDGAFVRLDAFNYLAPGVYKLTVQTSDGCERDTTFTLEEPGELIVDLGPDTTLQLGDSIALWNDKAVNYPDRVLQRIITPKNVMQDSCETCPVAPFRSFRYAAAVVDSSGCRAVDERTVVVQKARRVFVPNVFKPDADDANNLCTVYGGTDVEQVKSFRIMNRWGEIVHEYNNFMPNDGAAGWDGTIKGRKADPAVFVYFAEVLFIDGESATIKGDLTLLR
jgi:PKD-like domain/CHU_C Type IX secretion signal domain/SprB repeat